MSGKILFHEKCNKDLDTIAGKWKDRKSKGFIVWKEQMLLAYEDIFEFRQQAGKNFLRTSFKSVDEMSYNSTIRYLHLGQFAIAILYYINKEQDIIILGIQETGLANRERYKQFFQL